MSNDEIRFDELKTQFGPERRANQLTLKQFASLPVADAEELARKLDDYVEFAEILDIRKRAIQTLQDSQAAGQD